MRPETYLTVAELSALTKIAKSTWYQWAHEGRVPCLRLGACIRFDPAVVQKWLEQHTQPGRLSRVPAVEV